MTDDDALFTALAEALRSTPEAPAPGPTLPAIEGYTLGKVLHRGGQGVVHRAVQRSSGREVAVKLLDAGRGGERVRQRFQRELACAARLSHPNVVAPFDAGVSDGLAWCAMELVDGDRLDDWIEERVGAGGLRERVELFLQIGDGVAHAHERGVLHRDLKPSNVLIQPDGTARVLDFGLARPLDGDRWWGESITATGEFVGTLAYAAPEQLAGDDRQPDPRSDVYALGVLLFELLTGARPVDVSGKLSQALRAVLHDPPRDPADLVPDLPSPLRAVVLRALAKQPDQRHADVAALSADLRRWLAGQPVLSQVPPPPRASPTEPGTLARRRRPALLGALVLVVVLGALARLALDGGEPAEPRTEEQGVAELLASLMRPAGGMESLATRLAVLERARARLPEADPRGDPDLVVTLEQWLGEACLQLFLPGRAVEHLHGALLRLGDPMSLDAEGLGRRRELLCLLGDALIWLGDGDAAAVLAAAEATQARLAAGGVEAPPATAALLLARRADALATGGARHWFEQLAPLPGLTLTDDLPRDPAPAQAEALLERAAALLGPHQPGSQRAFGRAAQVRAELHEAAGRVDKALVLCRQACDAYRADPSLGGPHAQVAELQLARLLRASGDPEAAHQALTALVDRVRSLHGAESGLSLEILARSELRRGDAEGALWLLGRALQQQLRADPVEDPGLRQRAADLAAAFDEAEPLVEALDLQARSAAPGAFEVSRRASLVADACAALGRREQALALVEIALTVGCRDLGAACPYRRGALERAVRLCDELGLASRRAGHAAALATLPAPPGEGP